MVAIDHRPALIAPVCPLGKAQLGFHCAAGRAGLGTGIEAINNLSLDPYQIVL